MPRTGNTRRLVPPEQWIWSPAGPLSHKGRRPGRNG